MAAAILVAVAPWAASGFTTRDDYTARDFASGFPASSAPWAPIGLAFDQSDNMYVVDSADSNIYRFGLDGGRASQARISSAPVSGGPRGVAVGRDGSIYIARYGSGDVVQIDPGTGAVIRTIATGIPCATALAVDPVSGDLFVSQNLCGDTIFRVSNFQSGPGTTSAYAKGDLGVDGISFGSDGTLYGSDAGQILAIDGTSSPSPGTSNAIAQVPHSDGLAFAPVGSSGLPPYLVVNRTDGTVTRVDLGPAAGPPTDILTGGTRGDLAAVDSRGCLYVTQSDSVVKITPAHGTCELVPSTPGARPPEGLIIDTLRAAPRFAVNRAGAVCRRLTRLVIRLRQRGRIKVASATVYVNGKPVRRLPRRSASAPIVLAHLPTGAITVKVVARTTRGHRLSTTHRYANCSTARRSPKVAPSKTGPHRSTRHHTRAAHRRA
jgi:hypothetical protein